MALSRSMSSMSAVTRCLSRQNCSSSAAAASAPSAP